jgi:hypothetical protein
VIGRQPWVLIFSITGCGIDITLSMSIQQKCIHSLILSRGETIFHKNPKDIHVGVFPEILKISNDPNSLTKTTNPISFAPLDSNFNVLFLAQKRN